MDTEQFDERAPLLDGVPELPKGALAAPEPPSHLRDAVWRRTAHRVHGRVRRRRALVAAGLLVAYGIGVGTAHLFGTAPTAPPAFVARNIPEVQTPQAEPAEKAAEDPLPRQLLLDPEGLARRIAEAPREERAHLLELAGNRFLADLGDIKSATQCYRGALELMPPAERTQFGPNDDWLLASLKQARQQEVAHENANG